MYKVYKVISKRDANTVYVGSTKSTLARRLNSHTSDIIYSPNGKKNIWFARNREHLDIVQLSNAETLLSALHAEESELLKHIAEGYTVLNTRLPTNGKTINPPPPKKKREYTRHAEWHKKRYHNLFPPE